MNYDIAIIGGGPAGYTAAERAAEGGLKTVLFEKNAIGGVCLNEGCIPTKTLLYSAKILDSFKTSFKYGISPEGTPSFDMDKIIRRKNRTVKKLTSGVKMRLTSSGITIVEGTAVLNGETDGMIRIQCGNALFTVKNVLLCTGSETVIPPIKGLSDTDYWTSREALDSKELPKELAIIGGGVIGIEFASFFTSMGVKVKVIEMMPEILGAMDKEASAMLRTRIRQERGGISSEHKSDRSQPERGHCRKRRQDECDPRRQNPGQRRPSGNYQKFRSGKPFHRDGPPGRPSERIYADLPSARLCSRRYHRVLATGPHGLSGR